MKVRLVTLMSVLAAGAVICLGGCQKESGMEMNISGLETPADFIWEGDYIDENGGTAVLTIEKEGNVYKCSIGVPSDDMTHIDSYFFNAEEYSEGGTLEYKDGTHTSFDLPDTDDEGETSLQTTTIYENGTGQLYYLNGAVCWIEDNEDAGEDFSFIKQEEEKEEQ